MLSRTRCPLALLAFCSRSCTTQFVIVLSCILVALATFRRVIDISISLLLFKLLVHKYLLLPPCFVQYLSKMIYFAFKDIAPRRDLLPCPQDRSCGPVRAKLRINVGKVPSLLCLQASSFNSPLTSKTRVRIQAILKIAMAFEKSTIKIPSVTAGWNLDVWQYIPTRKSSKPLPVIVM